MRVYLSSTPDGLAAQRAAAEAVVRSLGWEPVARELDRGPLEQALRRVDEADLLLALVGWERGPVPEPEAGGDGLRPWAQWEVGRALMRGRRVLVMMASEAWPGREPNPEARAVVADFRSEVLPLAVAFDPEPAGVPEFERLLRGEMGARSAHSRTPSSATASGLALRPWPAPELPERPWPLLLPYSHPDLLAGREHELAQLIERLGRPLPIVGVYAASGAGKSSLLLGGLAPRLRGEGRAVVWERHPGEPGLAARLVSDLLTGPQGALAVADSDHATFVQRLLTARRRAHDWPPVLILDQLEEVLRGDRRARAVLGTLLAATVQRQPGISGPPCRWVLAYRREYHGELVRWLQDPLREARALDFPGVADLPHDLASLDRFHAWHLPPLGTPPPGEKDPAAAATTAFRAAIASPLSLLDGEGPRYPWRFAGDGAERLARAFGDARIRQPQAPLAPELQVVLAHLCERAGEPNPTATLVVPEDPARLIDDALEQHLARALDTAFPPSDRVARTRALLALRELADADGRRAGGRSGDDLARAIGREGREVLEKLQSPRARLVVAERHGDDLTYVLSHDRLAEVIVRAVEQGSGRLAVDPALLALRRFVALQTELFLSGEREQATQVASRRMASINAQAETLLADDDRRGWWSACRDRQRADRWRRAAVAGLVAVGLFLGGWGLRGRVQAGAAREGLLAQVSRGEPEAALAALARGLHDPTVSREELQDRLRQRAAPLDVLESGLGGLPLAQRSEVVQEVAALALPLLGDARQPAALASLLWALDTAVPPELARPLRERAIEPLRRQRPAPPDEGAGWVDIPAGTFLMGSAPGQGEENERPAHEVALQAFRALDHEVTNAEYRRFDPDHAGDDDRPAANVSWYAAYVYAAWLGGRLPTEAEWEYMARAGCRFEHCHHDGTEATVNEVAWTIANSRDTGEPRAQPVRRLQANPWGLFDVYGNLYEWTADWDGPYAPGASSDPRGPTRGGGRADRGGCYRYPGTAARPASRGGQRDPSDAATLRGFRPVRSTPSS